MTLTFIGKIRSVDLVPVSDQHNNEQTLLLLKVQDIFTGVIETIHYKAQYGSQIKESIGKYISIPHHFTILRDKAIFAISEQFQYSISDKNPILVKVSK